MQPNGCFNHFSVPPFGNIVKEGRCFMKWQRIEDLRIDHDLTQQQVADILVCKREVYRRYEKGTREIPLSYAIKLAQHYDVTLDYLVGLSDKKKN
jgi:transcriptional regulator with XRE-family HTH domain